MDAINRRIFKKNVTELCRSWGSPQAVSNHVLEFIFLTSFQFNFHLHSYWALSRSVCQFRFGRKAMGEIRTSEVEKFLIRFLHNNGKALENRKKNMNINWNASFSSENGGGAFFCLALVGEVGLKPWHLAAFHMDHHLYLFLHTPRTTFLTRK